MRALVVDYEQRRVRDADVPEPALSEAHDVLVAIDEVGICGTDREITSFHHGAPRDGAHTLVLGHEAVGEVVAVGTGVEGISPGDVVVPRVRIPCDEARCVPCRAGRADFCRTGGYREHGIVRADGFLAERVLLRSDRVHRVDPVLRDVAVLVEPLTIAEKAIAEIQVVQERLVAGWRGAVGRPRALVIGAGAVGLLGAMALVIRGFETWVWSREPSDGDEARIVRGSGATYLSSEENPAGSLRDVTGDLHLVYEAAGSPGAAFDVLQALGPNGVFAMTGVPSPATLEIDGGTFMRQLVLRNQMVLGCVNAAPVHHDDAIRDLALFAARFGPELRSLIRRRPFAEWPDAFAAAAAIKPVLTLRVAPEGHHGHR